MKSLFLEMVAQHRRWRNGLSVPVFAVLLVFAFGVQADAAEMKAGVAKVDVTPPPGTQMWGYFNRIKGAEGTLDPLMARVLVLEADGKRLAYVDLDFGRTFGPASLARLKEATQKQGIDYLIVQATHTHAGPVILDEYPSGPPAWETSDLDKIGQAIHEAAQRAVPVHMGVGYGQAYIGYNRVKVNPSGPVTMIWENPSRMPTWPVDPTVAVLRIDTVDGQPLAILVNYATHPVTFGPDMMRFSADFPGVMCKVVEESFGGKPLAFFVQGAPGDINVYDATTPITKDAIGRRDWAGQTLGTAAAETAKRIQTQADADSSIDFSEDVLSFGLRWDPEKFRQEILREISPEAFKLYSPKIQDKMDLPVVTALINHKIALMTMPGEPFLQFQLSWRERCSLHDCFFLGYTNGYNGYFPTIEAGAEGGYGAASASTWVELGAGERMLNHSVIELFKMLGRLPNGPRTDWKDLR